MNPEEDITLRRLVQKPPEAAGPLCPAPKELALLATGLLPPDRRDTLLDHAVSCDACGPLLRQAEEDFTEEIAVEETEAIADLSTATAAGRHELARRMARASRPQSSGWGGWIGKAAAVLVVAGASWFAWDRGRTPEPEQLIAQAFTERRTIEYRVRGAGHTPPRTERGVGSRLDRPQSLIAAEAEIAGGLKELPDDSRWLGMRGLVELWHWDADEAIATLRRALDQPGREDDPRLLADLGIAYALRAADKQRAGDYGQAVDYLGRALKADPNDAVALFNRAVVYEHMFLYELAEEDWRRFLSLEGEGGWAGEARRRMQDIQQKKKPGRQP
jgi:tetratricopeptide (TPR) repeat protein